MARKTSPAAAHARTATGRELAQLADSAAAEDVLLALVENPAMEEAHVERLLARPELSRAVIERIAARREWMAQPALRRAVCFHPHVPRLAGLRLLRQLYLFDLAELALRVAAPAELKRLAEELLLGRAAQLSLGQKISLARRGPGRLAAELLAEGLQQVVAPALENPRVTEAHLMRLLARDDAPPGVVAAIARHPKWSARSGVRVALVRHPQTPLARVLAFLPEIGLADLRDLCALAHLPKNLRGYLEHEIARRSRARRL
jgi:hypothetical protein